MKTSPDPSARKSAYTLVEVVLSVAIMGLVFAGLITSYVQGAKRAEWSGYSLAAQALAVQQVEQFRSATWDTQAIPMVDQAATLPLQVWTNLDIPISGTNVVSVTNFMAITNWTMSTNPTTYLKIVVVNTVWPWNGKLFTNTLVTYRSPDQ